MNNVSLGAVLEWKYGAVASTRQKHKGDKSKHPEMVISAWRHATIPQPDARQLKADFAEYEKFLKDTEYKKFRKEEYPTVEEQLDMIYKAIESGALDKSSDFYKAIKRTKDKFPKPENVN